MLARVFVEFPRLESLSIMDGNFNNRQNAFRAIANLEPLEELTLISRQPQFTGKSLVDVARKCPPSNGLP